MFEKSLFRPHSFSLAVPGFHCHAGFSLFAVSGGNSLVEVCGLLTAVASLITEQTLGCVGFSSCSVKTQ